jgi:DNA-binding CsgD family transcriptional regulator
VQQSSGREGVSRAVLVGRTAECGRIERMLADARAGSSSVLLLRGEPGIGKSALLRHAEELASAMNVLVARGIESEAEIPFSGLFDLLRPALGCLDRIPAQQAAALRGAFALGPPARASRFAIGAASLSLLAAYAEDRPVLVVVDDAQWIDASSADALAFATRRLLAEPVAAVIASRLGERSPFDAAALPVLELGGLDADATRALLIHHAGRPMPAETCAWLHRATAGNPLALIELAPEAPRLGVEPFDRPLAVETRVEQVFARQIGRLPEAARHALVIAAAAGTGDIEPIIRALGAVGLDAACLEEAEAARLLRLEPGGLEFRHPLMRSAAYHAAPPGERRAAHRALAAALDVERQADQRAWHLGSAALGASEEAAAALAQVAARAVERSAYAAAAAAFGRSAQLTLGDDARAERLLAAADAAWLSGAGEQAAQHLTEARQRAGRPQLRAEIEHLRARIALRQQPVLVSYDILVQAARTIASLDPARAALLLAEAAGDALMYAADVERMLRTARWAWELAQGVADEEVTIFASIALGQALIFSGQGAAGAQHLRRGLALMESSATLWRNPRLVSWAARGRLFLREREHGAAVLLRAVDAAREQGAIGMLPVALEQIGHDSATSDRWAAAHTEYAEGIRLAREAGQPIELCACLAGLSRLEARQGRADACRAHAAEALALAEQFGVGLYRLWAHLALTQLALGLGQLEDARGHGETATSVLHELGIADVDVSPTPELVEIQLRLGRPAIAKALVDEHCRRAAEKGLPWALARAARCRGLVADDTAFEACFVEALRQHDLTSDSFERGRSHLCFGERLRRARRRVHARRELRRAFELFDDMGAAPWAERARLELLATGETARRRDRRPLDRLTPQEFQIARMLAEGQTTRETATRLFLSPKTVEYHLRNAYDKLGIRTRAALVQALQPAAGAG